MSAERQAQAQLAAVVCGTGLLGQALVARLQQAGLWIITIDSPTMAVLPDVRLALHGDITAEDAWQSFANAIRLSNILPSLLAFTTDLNDNAVALLELAQAEWDHMLNHHVRAAYLGCKYLFPLMQAPAATVLSASTLGAWDTRPDAGALTASSGGILALSRTLALNGAALGIRVNTVCYDLAPSTHRDNQNLIARIPLGRPTTSEDVVNAMLFFLSDDASYLTGSSLIVDGGQSLQSWSNAPA